MSKPFNLTPWVSGGFALLILFGLWQCGSEKPSVPDNQTQSEQSPKIPPSDQPRFDAMLTQFERLHSKLDVGINLSDYTREVAALKAEHDIFVREISEQSQSFDVTGFLSFLMNLHIDAQSFWRQYQGQKGNAKTLPITPAIQKYMITLDIPNEQEQMLEDFRETGRGGAGLQTIRELTSENEVDCQTLLNRMWQFADETAAQSRVLLKQP